MGEVPELKKCARYILESLVPAFETAANTELEISTVFKLFVVSIKVLSHVHDGARFSKG